MQVSYIPWRAFYGLLGFSSSWILFYQYLNFPQSKLNIIINLGIVVVTILVINYATSLLEEHFGNKFYLQRFFIGFAFPLSVRICHQNIDLRTRMLGLDDTRRTKQ
jgi:hypothetical protein